MATDKQDFLKALAKTW